MCYDSCAELQNRSMKPPTSSKPARKTRTKTRKPKYVSLREELSPESSESGQMTTQLTLFPLHPENLFEEKEAHDHVDYFFNQDEGSGATSLTGILGDGGGGAEAEEEEEGSISPSLTSAYGAQDSEGSEWLEQAALRQRERDVSEEKWVVYSEVVERKRSREEMSGLCYRSQGLLLKLDYEEILNAWSDKGPLYIEGETTPQTVPDLAQDSANVYMDVGCMRGNAKQQWNVPDDGSSVIEDGGEGKMAYREARVMRYKEKRQSRLFSKRIRYEVRKINAEKRPRMKGRFVKRKSEDQIEV